MSIINEGKQIITPVLDNNSILLKEFGTKFELQQIKYGITGPVKLADGFRDNMFIGNFRDPDVDFEILIDNRKSDKTLGFDINIGKKSKTFVIECYDYWRLKALETNGKHLHFLSVNSEEGHELIGAIATDYGISYSEAEIVSSRIEFNNIEVQELKRTECRREAKGNWTEVGTGERGVICYGHQTDEVFEPYYGFNASINYEIKPFTIEVRTTPPYMR